MFLITNCEDNSDTFILNDFGFNEQSEHSPTPLEAETTTPAERTGLRNTNQYHYTSARQYVDFLSSYDEYSIYCIFIVYLDKLRSR